MIRIMIDWDFISPSIQTVSGIVSVDYVIDPGVDFSNLAKFRARVEPGSIGYQSLDDKGVPSVVLEAIKPQLDIMVRSYQQGVIMDKRDFSWIIEEDLDKARDELRKIPDRVNKKEVIYQSESIGEIE
jgi:hypothetical protein